MSWSVVAVTATGSSPPARGTVLPGPLCAGLERFIPACAGNGRRGITGHPTRSVHPRLRGERNGRCSITNPGAGSSPPARGTVQAGPQSLGTSRFIPACAGNGMPAETGSGMQPVHPRLRGERFRFARARRTRSGSSPPARGTGRREVRDRLGRRFIPACAGNGPWRRTHAGRRTVHPRLRGERFTRSTRRSKSYGSSPPARGTGNTTLIVGVVGRFIPACAGNGVWFCMGGSFRTVHPRLRGERRSS